MQKKKKKSSTAESASINSVGRHNSTRVDEGRIELKSSRDKNARHEPWWGRGEKSLLCDPGSELRLFIKIGGRENIVRAGANDAKNI